MIRFEFFMQCSEHAFEAQVWKRWRWFGRWQIDERVGKCTTDAATAHMRAFSKKQKKNNRRMTMRWARNIISRSMNFVHRRNGHAIYQVYNVLIVLYTYKRFNEFKCISRTYCFSHFSGGVCVRFRSVNSIHGYFDKHCIYLAHLCYVVLVEHSTSHTRAHYIMMG